ncbi:MAG: sialate O-acetylesterase [Planctomycetota bacterium]
MPRTPLVMIVGLLFVSVRAAAQVEIVAQDGRHRITATDYQAVVESDGCLTSLEVNGEELLNCSFSGSRGSYFYLGVVQRLAQIDQSGETLRASNDKAAIEYRFESSSMVWKVSSLADEAQTFFIVLDASVEAVATEAGETSRLGVNANCKRSAWFKGAARLEISGSDRLWDWGGSTNTVCEVRLEPRQVRTIELRMGRATEAELAAIRRLPPRLGEGPQRALTVLSPRPWQVFQRRTRDAGPVLISGRVEIEFDRVEALISGEDLPGRWFELSCDVTTRSINHELSLPAGGWYRLEVRAIRGGSEVARAVVEKFGLGEVFVTAGQSNSTNCGQFCTQQTSGMVAAFNGLEWRPGNDPFWGPHDISQGGSPWAAFGDALVAEYGVPVGIAVTGHGGTSVNEWQPGLYQTPDQVVYSALFHWMMVRIHQLGPQGFRAVLWHQGESDCKGETTASYVANMTRLVRASKQVAGWEFPWFVAQVSYHNPSAPRHANIRKAQAELWASGMAIPGPDTDQLTGEDRDFNGRGIHFSPQGLQKHGRLWAEKVIPWLEKQLGP